MSGPDEASRLGPAELVAMATVARRFYIDGESKVQIADAVGLSRFKVARMLDEARELGMVRIEIRIPALIDGELSEALRARYGLRHAVVVDASSESESTLREQLATTAADLMSEIVSDDDVLGLGWGRTLTALAGSLRNLASCTVVQLSGAVSGERVDESSVEVARRIGSIAGNRTYAIYAPLVLPDAATARGLRRQPQVRAAMSRHADVTKAFVAIGSWNPPNSQLLLSLAEDERSRLLGAGVCAEVCGTLIDEAGAEVRTDLAQRVISVDAEQLLAIPEVVAVAGGESKATAIRAAILGGFISGLVTDSIVARDLLDHA